MPIGIICSNCYTKQKFLNKFAGQLVQCPTCGHPLQLPNSFADDGPECIPVASPVGDGQEKGTSQAQTVHGDETDGVQMLQSEPESRTPQLLDAGVVRRILGAVLALLTLAASKKYRWPVLIGIGAMLLLGLRMRLDPDEFRGLLCGGVLVAGVICVVIAAEKGLQRRFQELELARAAYGLSLQKLKADPTNADLREQTLKLGRRYSDLTRNRKGVTIFDEVALMNDLNAASGGLVAPRIPISESGGIQSVENRLAQLLALKTKGFFNEEEYRNRKQQILGEL
jgi:hypothetical protein